MPSASIRPHVPAIDQALVPARRVLFLLEDLGGGTGNHVCRMLEEWTARGWRVAIVTQTPPLVSKIPPAAELIVMARGGWYDHYPVAQLRRLLALRRLVRSFRPDVVHTYFFWSIVYGRLLKLLREIPILIENREDMGFSWGWTAYQVLRFTRALPDRIICVAGAVRNVALSREKANPRLTTVVHNGVGPVPPISATAARNARAELGFKEEHVVVGMIANLPRTVKGGRRLLDAVAAIVARAPAVRFLLVGLGTEPASLEPELRARGIEGFVIGTGYRRDVASCYAAMDISVLTSTTEGLSITLLESMRAALPTVATHVGGNPELVIDGVTGYLVSVDDPEGFVDRVVTLALDPARRRAFGEAGRRRVEQRFTINDAARQYVEVYDELLGRSAPQPALTKNSTYTLEKRA